MQVALAFGDENVMDLHVSHPAPALAWAHAPFNYDPDP